MSAGITHDNIHLSKIILGRDGPVVCRIIDGCTDPKILEFVAAATAPNTRRAYQSDLSHFIGWGGCVPATSEQLARYLADHAASLSMATLARRLAGIRAAHVEREYPDPSQKRTDPTDTARHSSQVWQTSAARCTSQDRTPLSAHIYTRLFNAGHPRPRSSADRICWRISQIRALLNSVQLDCASRTGNINCASQDQDGSRGQGS